jgi:hypothetical protein
LQECGALINYDLPWNPMRVEQRIGRVDRIGQEYDEVTILNYSYEDTVETDIYERLDARIGLFENVVGDMQPILSSVSQQIRSATLESDRAESRAAVERADEKLSEEIESQKQSDRVDIGESLDRVENLVQQDVIDEAKLNAWDSYSHPDIVDVGAEKYEYHKPFTPAGLEKALTNSDALEEAGVELTPVTELDLDDGEDSLLDGFEFADSVFRLDANTFDIPKVTREQTIAEAIAPGEGAVAVTFTVKCVDEYPSIQYLAPGNPLLDELFVAVKEATEDQTRLQKYAENSPDDPSIPVVCGWGRDDSLFVLGSNGDLESGTTIESLSNWYEQFIQNRESSTSTS